MDTFGGFPTFDFPFALHCGRAGGAGFEPDERPRSFAAGEFSVDAIGTVVVGETTIEIGSGSDVETTLRILNDVDLESIDLLTGPDLGLE